MKKTLFFKHYALIILLHFSVIVFAQDFNIQQIQDDVGNSGSTNTSFTAVSALSSAFALPSNNRKTHAGRSDSNDNALEGDDMAGARVLTGTGTLTYYRESGSRSENMSFQTNIWEYTGAPGGANEFIVRGRYAVDVNAANFTNVDLTSAGIVSPNKCIPFITGIMNDDSANGADSATGIAHLDSATNLIVRRGTDNSANNVRFYITLVEFTGSNWTVLHGNAAGTTAATGSITLYDGYDATGTATNVSNWSNSIIFTHSKAETAASGGVKENISSQWPIMSPGSDNQTVDWTFDAGRATTNNSNRHFIHILNNTDINVTRFTDTSSADNETTIDITSAGLTNLNQSMVLGSMITAGTGNGYGQGWRNYYLNSITQAAHWCHRSGNVGGVSHNIQIIDFYTAPTQTEGPGGVTANLELWLKANAGVEEAASDSAENADPVLNWLDNTINTNDATQVTGLNQPIFTENVINFNPTVDFDGTNHEMTASTTSNGTITIFAVGEGTYVSDTKNIINLNSGGVASVVVEQTAATSLQGRYYDGTGPSGIVTTTVANGTPFLAEYKHVAGGTSELFDAGVSQGTASANADNMVSSITTYIGGHPSNSLKRWDGGIAEMIIFNQALTTGERDQVESYLAIKYGITLGINGTSQDYVDSDGTVIWDQSDNIGFNYNVTGIGQDDKSELNQKQSKTINTTNDITIGIIDIATNNALNTNTFFADKTFLLWGNDNGATTATTDITKDFSNGIAGLTSSVSVTPIVRKWKMMVNDSIPTIKLSIPESMVSSTNPGGEEYVMIVADDALFTTNVTSATMEDVGTELEVDFYFEGTKYITFGSTPEVAIGSRAVSFDGTDTYLTAGDVNDLANMDFTISAWIKRDVGHDKFDVISKRNYYNENLPSEPGPDDDGKYTHGYSFRVNKDGKFRMVWRDPSDTSNNTMQTSAAIPENEWHHICATFNSATNMTRLYIDGYEEDSDDTLDAINVPSDEHFMIGATHYIKRQQRHSGSVDEVRVWNVTLSEDQIRYIMNQEIINNSNFADGVILPTSIAKNEIAPIPWANLIAYYPMNTLVFGSVKDESNSGNDASMINYDNLDEQTAPLPYKTTQNGDWDTASTWANGDVQYLPGVDSYLDVLETIDYNIVQIDHNVTMDNSNTTLIPASKNGNRTVLGLVVNGSGDLQIDGVTASNTGYGLTVTHYLKLDGTIDLEGESQLIQTDGSDLDATSSGTLERDQQGNSNTYLYNYWCSPVGVSNATTNNNSYTLPDVFTNVAFLTSGLNGTTAPANADYWIWKYANLTGDQYSLWQHVRSTGSLNTGEGFTMKGPGTVTPDQNYILQGKPNNGDFTLTLGAGNEYLVGNPYPSAMDADEFIRDNISATDGGKAGNLTNVINGALYFWDHFANNSHFLTEYEGGYAIYTLMGGSVAISNDTRINASGQVGTMTPQQYIPVGQGFFVSSIADASLVGDPNDPGITLAVVGGNVQFKNSQRAFIKESVSESLFHKNGSKTKSSAKTQNIDTRQKIRLMYDSPEGYHRQLLVGVDSNASNNFDLGYDALLAESNKEDMYWQFNSAKLIIQAVNNFNDDQILPLGIKTNKEGLATIKIDALENIDSNTNIYVHDKELDLYHDLKDGNYEVYLAVGEYSDRFAITFSDPSKSSLGTDDFENAKLEVYFSNEKESFIVHNPDLKYIESVSIYNILGQSIYEFNSKSHENYIEHKTKSITAGVYIVKMKTNDAILSKKILIK